jgi:hypothetical protein
MALCYAFALQTFLAAYSIALAVSPASGTAAGFVICHNVGDDGATDPDTRTPVSVPCALCAMVASAIGLLPDPILTIVGPSTVADRVRHNDATVIASSRPARAGLARAPPLFA